jgi:nicotinate phosphoribosyltransferase
MTDTSHNRWFAREGLALLTDMYELTMMAGYLEEGRADNRVCFEYFFRSLPVDAGFAIAAGLEPFLQYLEALKFEDDDIDYLRSLDLFEERFLVALKEFRPACTVRAVPEGTLVFPNEPIVQVEGRIFETQLLETALLNLLNHQTLIASKSARIYLAAKGEPVMEFGLRRAHGPDGGVSGTRAAYIGGCSSTSNVLAGKIYGIPVSGTHAHSWVMSFASELEAFRAFVRHYPHQPILLVDTYDTLSSGVPNAITVFKELHAAGNPARPAIRLDSGDLAKLSKGAYALMRDAGFDDPLIVASNDLEEDLIADIKNQGAKINAWGVGTHLITARNNPSLNGVYKLVATHDGNQWKPRIKLSQNIEKATVPARKRSIRYRDRDGVPIGDVLYHADEQWPASGAIPCRRRLTPHRDAHIADAASAEDVMQLVFENGRRVAGPVPIDAIRDRTLAQLDNLPDEYKRLRNPERYRVLLSPAIGQLIENMIADPAGLGAATN